MPVAPHTRHETDNTCARETHERRRAAALLRRVPAQGGALRLVAVQTAPRQVVRAGVRKGIGAAGEVAQGRAAVASGPRRGAVCAPVEEGSRGREAA